MKRWDLQAKRPQGATPRKAGKGTQENSSGSAAFALLLTAAWPSTRSTIREIDGRLVQLFF